MKKNDFATYISDFLSKYLPGERGYSRNTILAYKDCFLQLITFLETKKNINIQKITLATIKKETIVEFLTYLQEERKCTNSTINTRLGAIHSFYKFLQYESIENLAETQKILSIRTKKTIEVNIKYLTLEGIKLLLQQPDTSTRKGRRDLTLIALMYDTGCRVQEVADITPSRLRLSSPSVITVTGKGNKSRYIPLLPAQTAHLVNYITENKLDDLSKNLYPLFHNSKNEKLTRGGISHILSKYVKMAREINPSLIPKNISCHSLRHSKAMHLFQAGVDLVYIRDILGHSSIKTTEIYARADSMQKRKAIENAYVQVGPEPEPMWQRNNIKEWLSNFPQ